MAIGRNLYSEVTARILSEMKAGTLPWVKPWSTVSVPGTSSIPHNAATGRPYSGCNVILLWLTQTANAFRSPRYMTFKQAQTLGATVKKGSKGTPVYFVGTVEKEDEKSGKKRNVSFLRCFTVFNVDQIEGLSEEMASGRNADSTPIAKPRNPDLRDATIDEFVEHTGAKISEGHSAACYIPGVDAIQMPAFEAFKSGANFYATEFHELAHWTGAKSRLGRDFSGRFGSQAYAAEELVAELTAAFLCAEFGVDGDIRHAAYINNWIRLLESDDKAFFTAASAAQKAADYMRGLALASDSGDESESLAIAA